jgi:hypothetical protein
MNRGVIPVAFGTEQKAIRRMTWRKKNLAIVYHIEM